MRAARIDERLAQYRLDDRRGQRAGTMSGGQKQRLALAAATLHEPDLLLLDEPTSAVDPQSRRDFWESLFELVDRGTTILVSTHYMDEAERCHGLAILDRGRLVAEGSPRRLMDAIDATVIEIEADDVRAARHALDGQEFVKSVAQLGNRLHALLARDKSDPEGRDPRAAARSIACQGNVERVRASLEDVFVAATRFKADDDLAWLPDSGVGLSPTIVMSRIFAIASKEVRQLRRDRLTFGMIVGIPLMQMLLFGYAINFDVRGLRAAVVDEARTSMSRALVADMRASGVVRVREYAAFRRRSAAAVCAPARCRSASTFPRDFERRRLVGDRPLAQLLVDGSEPTHRERRARVRGHAAAGAGRPVQHRRGRCSKSAPNTTPSSARPCRSCRR